MNCAKEVITIFELYSTGSNTFSSLSALFNKKQIKDYRDKTIKFSKQLIQRILNNSFYIGLLKVKDHEIRQGKHKPLIPVSLWQKCQDLQHMKSNHAINHRLINHPEFPLRRFTLCGFCHHPLIACFQKDIWG
ncbi:recombinase family protein [Candidatus Roizmanbacteria bacterium]|nr:recombinase family protein [Candidatus Roizmanbacteria bacterium]